MASFEEAPAGDAKAGEKIFKTKCAQCHTVDKGAGHKQGSVSLHPSAASKNEDGSLTAFDWRLKINIITGVARGLFYLHAQEKMVHGDLKSNMILLDEKYDPMIANVGLSKLMPATPRFRNNCAPELLNSANATTEIDVYSLGIVMLEILTRESTYKGIHPLDLPTWVLSVPTEKWFTNVFDVQLINENIKNHNVLVKVMRLALQCVVFDPKARPTSHDVLWTMEQIKL